MLTRRQKNVVLAPSTIYRQGDVAIIRVLALPGDTTKRKRDKGRVILAYGEATGHAHAILEKGVIHFDAPNPEAAARGLLASVGLNVEVSEHNAPSFLEVEEKAQIVHDEHAPVTLQPGHYVVLRQREWSDADEPIQVAD